MQKTTDPGYDYHLLQIFLEESVSPRQIARHLDLPLFYLVYYHDKEEQRDDLYKVYADIFDFKLVLQHMQNPFKYWNYTSI